LNFHYIYIITKVIIFCKLFYYLFFKNWRYKKTKFTQKINSKLKKWLAISTGKILRKIVSHARSTLKKKPLFSIKNSMKSLQKASKTLISNQNSLFSLNFLKVNAPNSFFWGPNYWLILDIKFSLGDFCRGWANDVNMKNKNYWKYLYKAVSY